MTIDLSALRTYIKANEQLNQLGVVEGNTGAVARWFAAGHDTEKKFKTTYITEVSILNAFENPLHAEAFMQKLEAIAQSQSQVAPLVARVVRLIKERDGINIADPRTLAQLAALKNEAFGNAAVTQDEIDAVTALSFDRMKTRGEVEFGATPTIRNIDAALKPDRTADGKLAGSN